MAGERGGRSPGCVCVAGSGRRRGHIDIATMGVLLASFLLFSVGNVGRVG